jgi:ubiquinone/menaquinone biosynthesis C-methylase UbiE
METKEILKYLKSGQRILDIGCGNGYKDVELCKQRNVMIKGIDYSEEMIKIAKQYQFYKLKFEQGDILNLNETEKYDVVITDRCLINLESVPNQIKAIENIYDVLKPNGTYLMMECTKNGLVKINEIRLKLGLEAIKERWHNNYLRDGVLEYIKNKFKQMEINNFNSTYFLISRTINALLGNQYDSDINKYAAKLPSLGNYASLKLFILRK